MTNSKESLSDKGLFSRDVDQVHRTKLKLDCRIEQREPTPIVS